MKRLLSIFLFFIGIGVLIAGQPARKAFVNVTIDGKLQKVGEVNTVKLGQKLLVDIELVGGRRDYCMFPDTYSDITGTVQILSRGKDGMTYQRNGKKAEWKLISEVFRYSGSEYVKINKGAKQSSAEFIISNTLFSQTSVTVTIIARWQLTEGGISLIEENVAEETLFFQIQGQSNVWFISKNIKATGISNDLIKNSLIEIQACNDSIEKNLRELKFSVVQQAIRNLQAKINALGTTIQSVKAATPSYQSKFLFIGLPSNLPYTDISTFATIVNNWKLQEQLLADLSSQINGLPANDTKANKDKLIEIIAQYVDWQYHLPENTFQILPSYAPKLDLNSVKIPGNIHFIAEEKTVTNYSQTLSDLKSFLSMRSENIADEIQLLSSVQSRMSPIRLFDGMLRSYFSSISWAEWESTREL